MRIDTMWRRPGGGGKQYQTQEDKMRVTHGAIVAAAVLAAACDVGSGTIGISGVGGSGAATHLVFTVQPSTTHAGLAISPAIQVVAASASGATDPTFTNSVTMVLGTNPGGGTLSGTATIQAVSGVATFSNLSINNVGAGYTLVASTPTRTPVTSAAFTITATGPVAPR
jgi:hypothetical protein